MPLATNNWRPASIPFPPRACDQTWGIYLCSVQCRIHHQYLAPRLTAQAALELSKIQDIINNTLMKGFAADWID
jgi:hypothetical protein